ncbi:hypothetical protein R6Q57_017562 [Mikania cordata]
MGFDAEYRTYHQLNSKWKDICTKLTKFSGIYSNCANNRKSGMSDENVLKRAEKEYQLKSNGQTFNHYHVWVAIKDSPKFRVLCQEGYEWGRVFSGVTIVGVKGFQWDDVVKGNFSGKGFSVG